MITPTQAKEIYWTVSNPKFKIFDGKDWEETIVNNSDITLSRWEADGMEQSRNSLYTNLRCVKDIDTLSFTFHNGKTEKTFTLNDLFNKKILFSNKEDLRFIEPYFESLPNNIRMECANDSFVIDGKSPIRLDKIPEGTKVDLYDFTSYNRLYKDIIFSHWEIDGIKISAPTKLKDAPQNIIQVFSIMDEDNEVKYIKLIKDPDGFGAMFLQIKIGRGNNTRTKIRRITAYS